MSSATSPVREALEGYLAGRVTAERVVAVVAEAYYGEAGDGRREALRPVVEIFERAAPGGVELARSDARAGFDIKPREREFPKQYESDLRAAARAALSALVQRGAARGPASPGMLARLVLALRRLLG